MYGRSRVPPPLPAGSAAATSSSFGTSSDHTGESCDDCHYSTPPGTTYRRLMNAPIWRGPTVPVESAFVDEMALRAVAAHPHRPAVVDARTGRSLTFGELHDRSRRFAAGLAERAVGRGDVVALVAAGGPDYAQALYGTLAGGAAVASANPALTASELTRQFARTTPRLVLADRWSRAAVEAALRLTTGSAALHSLDDDLADLLSARAAGAAERDPDDLALLFPSSGTTGLPKIAAHSHRGTTAFLQALATVGSCRWTADDVVGLVVPFTHLYGTAILSHALGGGATVVTWNAPGFDLEAYLRLLQDHAVTVGVATPPVLLGLARSPMVERFDLSPLRLLLSSAAPCPAELQDEVAARLGCQVIDSLGSTEAWCYSPPADAPVRGSVGTIGPNMEAAVVDPRTGARLGPDQPGELWIRGPQVMRGHLGAEEPAAPDADGWLHTGDICSVSAGGDISLIDRVKELIKVGGYSVAPAEVERELLAHPAVADAAVVGRPDGELGEVPVGYVALRAPMERAELQAWLQGRLAPWKHIRDVVVVERVPRSPTGKVLRRELIEREREQSGAQASR